jgi:hypothetical protein
MFTSAPLAPVAAPTPVRRYLAWAIPQGQTPVRSAHMVQRGEFAMRPGRWKPFTATEDFTVTPPGFVWDARIRVAPLVSIHVRDRHHRGEGDTDARLFGAKLVNAHGTRALAEASLQRFLAEAVWFPTVLRPSAQLEWTPLGRREARATLSTGDLWVSIDFEFGARGEIIGAATDRYRDVNGTAVLTRWEGVYNDYARVGGMMIPRAADCWWVLPNGRFPYWRGRMISIDYA